MMAAVVQRDAREVDSGATLVPPHAFDRMLNPNAALLCSLNAAQVVAHGSSGSSWATSEDRLCAANKWKCKPPVVWPDVGEPENIVTLTSPDATPSYCEWEAHLSVRPRVCGEQAGLCAFSDALTWAKFVLAGGERPGSAELIFASQRDGVPRVAGRLPLPDFDGQVWLRLTVRQGGEGVVAAYRRSSRVEWMTMPRGVGQLTHSELERARALVGDPIELRRSPPSEWLSAHDDRGSLCALCTLQARRWQATLVTEQWQSVSRAVAPSTVVFSHISLSSEGRCDPASLAAGVSAAETRAATELAAQRLRTVRLYSEIEAAGRVQAEAEVARRVAETVAREKAAAVAAAAREKAAAVAAVAAAAAAAARAAEEAEGKRRAAEEEAKRIAAEEAAALAQAQRRLEEEEADRQRLEKSAAAEAELHRRRAEEEAAAAAAAASQEAAAEAAEEEAQLRAETALVVRAVEATFERPGKYFVTLAMTSVPAEEGSRRTDVVEQEKEAPPNRAHAFLEGAHTWRLPAGMDPNEGELSVGVTQLLFSRGAKEVGTLTLRLSQAEEWAKLKGAPRALLKGEKPIRIAAEVTNGDRRSPTRVATITLEVSLTDGAAARRLEAAAAARREERKENVPSNVG